MTNLMHNYVIKNVYYYNPLHVSSNTVIIIRSSNCANTASGIVLHLYKWRSGVHTGPSLTDSTIPDAVLIQFELLMTRTMLLETCREFKVKSQNQQDATNSMFFIKPRSQHVLGIIMPIIRRIRPCPTACGVLHCLCWLWSCGAASWAACTVWKLLFEQ